PSRNALRIAADPPWLAHCSPWNISFAGCGFRSVYYLGAVTSILERAAHLVYGASKICGASSGCLVAAALTVGLPIGEKARKHHLSIFHPTFSLQRTVRNSLQEKLPADAHRRASGRLCVSLTRMSDGSNVLVSHFDSREELIQVLMCSCFFPVYCGLIPPSYRGQLYMDGALSNNMPLLEHPNTITMAPFCSESDISPKDGAWTAISVHCNNLNIQVTAGNVRRIYTSFLPPAPEVRVAQPYLTLFYPKTDSHFFQCLIHNIVPKLDSMF
uniref:PNPLA domain-containing protein n=1 Tax=Hippocampus comes TaxID=109280 RepID=A0A3Q2YLN2_HIPCM